MIEKSGKNDPELNEILGSIRRIISEDNAQPNARPANAGAALDDDEEILDLEDDEEILDLEEDEEILDLTEEVAVDVADDGGPEPLPGSVADEAPEPESRPESVLGMYSPEPAVTEAEMVEQPESLVEEFPTPPAQEFPEPMVQEFPEPPAQEFLESPTQEIPEPMVQEFPAPTRLSMAESPEEPAPTPASSGITQESEIPVEPEPVFQPAPVFAAEPVRKVVSEAATTAAATALGELTRAMDEKTDKLKVGAGDTSVSDMVKEMLRPMLREWLDENLPGMVERIVRREIEKLVDRAETED